MRKLILSIIFMAAIYVSHGANPPSSDGGANVAKESTYGVETLTSDYFDKVYLYNNLVYYLDYQNLHITYESDTIGEFNQPDQMVFSVEGSSFKWNKYYLDGFRIDSRFFVGSTLYTPNMSNYDFALDYIDSKLHFDTSASRKQSVELNYNLGGIGGMSAGTSEFIRLLHPTAPDRAYKPIEERNSIKGAGTADVNFVVKGKDRDYMQNIYLNYGQRYMVGFDNTGINDYYPENYGKIQIGGELPITLGSLFDQTNYLAIYSQRDHLNAEFYYGEEECSNLNSYGVSFYGTKRSSDINYTSGFNFALNNTKHDNLNYSRNVIDHDGEGFEPWSPDGSHIEFSHALTLEKPLNDWLTLTADCYNSLMRFNTSQSNFYNTTYSQLTTEKEATMLYLYEWESNSFYSGLLENSVGVSTEKRLNKSLFFKANVDFTLDAMLVSENSRLSPNVEFRAGLKYTPKKWLDIELNLGRERVSYNIDDIEFLSADYLSGNVYYIEDKNGNGSYDSGEKGSLFTTTGGKYHSLSKDARQQAYYVVDIPINLYFGRHTFSFLQTYRKYSNTWSVGFDGDYSDYGYMEQTDIKYVDAHGDDITQSADVFYFNGGQQVNYVVEDYPDGIMGGGFFTSTPFYMCSNMQYTYTAPKFMISINWQSYMMSGLSTLGNGPLHNNLGALSESSANPNTYNVLTNADSETPAVGRLNQDRAYIARIFTSFKVTPKLTMAMNAKFKDGQPFSSYQVEIKSDGAGNQVAMLPDSSRGINTSDGNFGKREDGVYTIDVRLKYETLIAKRRCEIGAYCYNIYDFGNELTEYIFDQDIGNNRNAMSLTIPRGLIFSFKMDL